MALSLEYTPLVLRTEYLTMGMMLYRTSDFLTHMTRLTVIYVYLTFIIGHAGTEPYGMETTWYRYDSTYNSR